MAVRTKRGRVYSDADLGRMADEAEAGYDLSTWRRRPGRPALDAGRAGEPSPRIGTRVPERLREAMARYASEDGKSMSDVLRELIDRYVAEREAGEPVRGRK